QQPFRALCRRRSPSSHRLEGPPSPRQPSSRTQLSARHKAVQDRRPPGLRRCGSFERQMGQGGVRVDAPGLGQIDPLVSQRDLELAVSRQHERNSERECAALSWLTIELDVTAQELGKLSNDGQSKPGAVIFAGEHVVCLAGKLSLAEFLENRFAIFL